MGWLISLELFALKILFLVLNFVICFSCNEPEGLISLLENFSLKADEKVEDARSRIYRLLWAKLWVGCTFKVENSCLMIHTIDQK